MPLPINNQTLGLLITDRLHDLNWDALLETDWGVLISKARAEGVAPLLYWNLSKSGRFSSLPEEARNNLRALYSATWINNQKILRELEILAHLYSQAGIPLVVLKGACFALTVYPDIGLRPMGDLDVLVPKEKLAEAGRIAETLGYAAMLPEASFGLNDLLSHHLCLQKNGPHPISLEIHDSLVADKSFIFAVPVGWFWGQTESLHTTSQTKFKDLQMLSPVGQILFAAAHAMLQHGGRDVPLRWFYDLDLLIRKYSDRIDWDLLLLQATKFEWVSALDAALSKAYAYFDTPIPEKVRVSLFGQTDRHQAFVALMQIKPATHILEELQKLLSLNLHGRFRLLLSLILPDPAYMRWRYQLKNSRLLPVYYLIRWIDILKDAIYTFFNLMKRLLAIES